MSPLLRSLEVAAVAALVALGLGLAWAALARVHRFPGGRLWRGLELLPLVMPPYLAAVAWLEALGPAGWLADALGRAGPLPTQVSRGWVDTPWSAGLLLGGCWFPLVSLAAGAGLLRLDQDQLEAARLCRGAPGAWRLRWAAARGPALAGALGVFALGLVELAVPQILRVGVRAEDVLRLQAENDLPAALRAAGPLLALAALAVALAAGLAARGLRSAGAAEAARELAPVAPGPARGAAGVALLCALLTPGLWLPVVWLGLRLARAPADAAHPGPLSAARAALAAAWRDGGGDAVRSLELGLLTASVAASLALAVAWPLRRAGRPLWLATAPAGAALVGLVAVPGPLLGGLLLRGLNASAALSPALAWLWAPALACLLRFGPLAVALLLPACARVPREQEEAAALAGAGPWRRLLRVGLPALGPALVAAWLVVYVLTVTEYSASVVLAAPGSSLLAVFVVNEAHYGQGDVLSGLFTLLLGVGLAPLALLGAARGWALRFRGAGPAGPARTRRWGG